MIQIVVHKFEGVCVSPRDKILSTLRTGVAAGIGALATWLATHLGVILDDDSSTTLIAAAMVIATTTYHARHPGSNDNGPKWPCVGRL
jgi:hypothetical protein